MKNSAGTQRGLRARCFSFVVIGASLAFLGFNVAAANAAVAGNMFSFSDIAFSSKGERITSYNLSYSANSCQPLRVKETGFNPSWPRIESDASTSLAITRARLDVGGTRGTGRVYTFGSPMTFDTATESGTGATETLTFTMSFNSVTIKAQGHTTTIDCWAP